MLILLVPRPHLEQEGIKQWSPILLHITEEPKQNIHVQVSIHIKCMRIYGDDFLMFPKWYGLNVFPQIRMLKPSSLM